MDAYEALKETVDDLFQQAVEEGCYTEDEAAELVESLDIYSLLQVVRHNATTVYSYITQGRQDVYKRQVYLLSYKYPLDVNTADFCLKALQIYILVRL